VRFVQAYDAEKALLFYRRGNIDVVSNAAFEPLAIKLLQPYRDFRRETYAALTYYTINRQNFPFSDKRVREALAISIDRKRLSEDVAGGTTVPAVRLLPETAKSEEHIDEINEDAQRGRDLLALAGFPNGEGFPTIRLLINRNDQQRLLATFIATMWRGNLGLKTEIIIKEWDDYERLLYSGEFDIARRGVVMQATDEATSMRELFSHESNSRSELTEAEAMQDRRAIPIYFASSFSMVKPYVKGFETRLLDAPLLRTVRIDTQWQER
jgi:oligopeptide transport system substrate-binding protein